MPSLFPIEECDMDRLYEIEQAAHLVPWSLGTLKNNVGERYLNLKLVEKEQVPVSYTHLTLPTKRIV